MKISKELLGEVLGINNISSIIYDIDFPNIIEYSQYATLAGGRRSTEINIYELAFKLKIWAEEVFPEIYIATCIAENGEEWVAWSNNAQYIECYFYADTELEATIKACEWVLEKINGNK